ncbi:MAG: electron transfer flavoprotein subunit beta/FixA family protein [Candidatus Aminicenantes bacterium]|nr:electron transfer flavoprotein subunit beta/FixA family protein [Candidatus Aminicenantes bacterium]
MNIIVCVKKIPDPEIPPAKFKLDPEALQVIPPEGIPPIMSPYDEQAVELAVRLKEKNGGTITVLSIDEETSLKIIRHALAMGSDKGMVLADPAFVGSDSFSTATILAQAIKKLGDYDLILCGRQAADWDEGLVGSILAEKLDLPLVTLAVDIELTENHLKVKRATLDGYQVFVVPQPAVVSVSSEVGQPRLPSGWGIISASKKEVPVWNASDIEVDPTHTGPGAARRKLVKLFIPERKRECEIVEAETTGEAAGKLAERLKKEGLV